MHHSENCLFCKIIAGTIPSAKVYEDEYMYAFLDISQVTKGHTLVVPKIHKENIFELTPEIAAKTFAAVPKIAEAIKTEFNPIGLNLLNNNGKDAGQTIFHFHIHIIPRYEKNDGFDVTWKSNADNYTSADLQQIAASIAHNLS
ncbi:HIT family protein [Ectobacillus antri]|uniref:HIT family protein n=1 Tax=Ectobacillus antri TaxID=2486280 RepID=A0ABT6H3D3_9BACI|nr:HIT family protein [Ectobacillus antri]MDG4656736.1 HIT family protein [Ectobacillus antri]MDG5753901.1 HIT family protein [Ectobacillus antri]